MERYAILSTLEVAIYERPLRKALALCRGRLESQTLGPDRNRRDGYCQILDVKFVY